MEEGGEGPILELFAVPDLFATGALEIEHLGQNVRVTFVVERIVRAEKPKARVPVACLVFSAEDCRRIGIAMVEAGSVQNIGQIRLVTLSNHRQEK